MLVTGSVIVGLLWIVAIVVYGRVKISETKARYPVDGVTSTPPSDWWKEANVRAMRSDDRVRGWMKRGLMLLIVGIALTLLGIFDTPGVVRSALFTCGLVFQAFGLAQLIAWSRLLAGELANCRS